MLFGMILLVAVFEGFPRNATLRLSTRYRRVRLLDARREDIVILAVLFGMVLFVAAFVGVILSGVGATLRLSMRRRDRPVALAAICDRHRKWRRGLSRHSSMGVSRLNHSQAWGWELVLDALSASGLNSRRRAPAQEGEGQFRAIYECSVSARQP